MRAPRARRGRIHAKTYMLVLCMYGATPDRTSGGRAPGAAARVGGGRDRAMDAAASLRATPRCSAVAEERVDCSTSVDEEVRLAGPAGEIRTWDTATTDYCLDRIVTTNDGGVATLDSKLAEGVRIETVAASVDGAFTPWVRDGERSGDIDGAGPRGNADWYIPQDAVTHARLLFLHGGGYTWYAPQDDVYRSFGTRLAQRTKMPVLAIDYRLAPEHPHPACVEDADKALRWLAVNGPDGPDSPTKTDRPLLFVAGDSAGGGLSAALALRTRESVGPHCPAIAGLVLMSPWLDLTGSGSSYQSEAFNSSTRTGDPIFLNNLDPSLPDGNKVRGWGLEVLGAKDKPRAEQVRGQDFMIHDARCWRNEPSQLQRLSEFRSTSPLVLTNLPAALTIRNHRSWNRIA